MTQTSTYGEYGNRQNEFSYLCAESQAEIVEYCRNARDVWANAYRAAKKLSRTNLSLAGGTAEPSERT